MTDQPSEHQHGAHYLTEVLRRQTAHLEKVLHADAHLPDCFQDVHLPAWLRCTEGEQRLPVTITVVIAIFLQAVLPHRFALQPHYLLPGLEAVLAGGLVAANPRRINRQSRALRGMSLVLIGVITVANTYSAIRLVWELVGGRAGESAGPLLATGTAIWGTNVIVFGLWYWELDRGGPVARALGHRAHPDFLFTQMQAPEMAPPDWEPAFLDYLYLSFTNATAFSPTDVMPLARWAKMTMLVQSAVSIVAVALVVARAVNVLK
ncbi:hypothetical protein [Actinoallomurus sp. NPDC050550]|uniref:hypothetical protein n=1 Tax=Actinoallomurus sp. NPDC050550 TaxID=3154937 RepID=UPI0033C4E05C